MYRRILVATDGSELASKALAHGLALAKPLSAEVTIATVTDRWPLVEVAAQADMGVKDPVGYYKSIADKRARLILADATRTAQEAGVASAEMHVEGHHPAEGVLEAAKQSAADLIVIASHGRRGISRLLLGSVAQEVATRSSVPVLIVRGGANGSETA